MTQQKSATISLDKDQYMGVAMHFHWICSPTYTSVSS